MKRPEPVQVVKQRRDAALQSLIQRALDVLRFRAAIDKISKEEPPAYDPQANGCIDVGVMLILGLLGTLKLGLVAR